MLSLSEKQALLDQLIRKVSHEYQTLLAAHKATQEGATHEEARPENDKDTRALEQTYLARGQAERVSALKEDVDRVRTFSLRSFDADSKIGLGALVRVESEDGATQLYFLAPAGAGETLESKLGGVKVVTPRSPLGRSLFGSVCDDDVELKTPTGKRNLSIVDVS